jgi:hypothetical protein
MEKMSVLYDRKNILVVILVAALIVLFLIIINLVLKITIVQNLVMCWIVTVIYSLFAYFMVDNLVIRRVESERIVERPVEVIKEVFIPVENKTIEFVEKPIIREVPVYVKEPVYIKQPVINHRINIPKYDYVASSETQRYHLRNCRLAKLIKNKYKIHNNSDDFFKKKNFKGCKVCIKKEKKC